MKPRIERQLGAGFSPSKRRLGPKVFHLGAEKTRPSKRRRNYVEKAALRELRAGVGAGRAGEELVNMHEHAALCRDRRTHRREAAVHPRLQFLELLTLVDVGSRAVNLVGALVSPEGDGNLLVLLQVLHSFPPRRSSDL